MLDRVRQSHPEARLDGFSVQAMARRPAACELILGLSEDPQFGPVLLIGQGGSGAEVLRDRGPGSPPLNLRLAMAMLEETRVHARLRGGAGLPCADLGGDRPWPWCGSRPWWWRSPRSSSSTSIPLLADADGILALDARIRLRPGPGPGSSLKPRPELSTDLYPNFSPEPNSKPSPQTELRPCSPIFSPSRVRRVKGPLLSERAGG